MRVRRPIEAWSSDEVGTILDPDGGDTVGMYVLLGGRVAAWLLPGDNGAGWRLAEVPTRARVVISGRYPERNLLFPSEPSRVAHRADERDPIQRLDPRRLKLVYTGDQRGRLVTRRGQTYLGDWDLDVDQQPFEESPAFAAYAQRVGGARWSTIDAPPEIAGREARRAFEAVHKIVSDDGFRAGEGDPGADPLEVALARTGRYLLVDGRKRLAVARLLQLPEIPIRVVARHPDWEILREEIVDFAGRRQGRVYQHIHHPDLEDLRASWEGDRLDVVVTAFEGYDIAGKRLMDIGAQWGQVSRAMEDLGFEVTAVEANPQSADMAARLRDATESRFEVWHGSVFEFSAVEEQNVIVGLNIFHHFLKKEESYNGLVSVLNRSNADMIIFSSHVYERRGPDMRDAYRNYPPEDFAQFVADESGLSNIKLLGLSHDGRKIFKISR